MKMVKESTIIFLILIFSAFPAHAKIFSQNGYDLELYWKVKNKGLLVWGSVKNGKYCRSLKIKARFYNKKVHQETNFYYSFNKPHTKYDRSLFKKSIYANKKTKRRDWKLEYFDISCGR